MHDDSSIVAARLRQQLLREPADAQQCLVWLESVGQDGTWADVDYSDGGDWRPFEHLSRLKAVAIAVAQGQIADDLRLQDAYRWWIDNDPHQGNWWYREIGIPIALGDICLLRGVSGPDLGRVQAILARSVWEMMTAQNTVWAAHGRIRRGIITADPHLLAEAFGKVRDAIMINPGGEGIQPDMSFHQHGPQPYSGGYGHGFIADTIALAWAGRDTAFAFSEQEIDLLADLILDGQQWMIHGRAYDFTVVGRENTRLPHERRQPSHLSVPVSALIVMQARRSAELAAMHARVAGEPDAAPLLGARYFFSSDYLAIHRPHWSASLRMTSPRTVPTETGAGEGIKNAHLGDGINPVWLQGDEYEPLPPVWDWCQLPGLTASQTAHPWPVLDFGKDTTGEYVTGPGTFAAGVSDGYHACAAMDLATAELSAFKAWFFFGNEYVGLITGIQPRGARQDIRTTINQTLRRGPITEAPNDEQHQWIHHGQVGYTGLLGTRLQACSAVLQGNWNDINATQPADRQTAEICTVWTVHNSLAPAAYLVRPWIAETEMAEYIANLPVTILANDNQIQAVHHDSGQTHAVFRKAGAVTTPGGLTITVDRPALLLAKHGQGQLTISSAWPGPGNLAIDVSKSSSGMTARITVVLPDGVHAGHTVTTTIDT